MLIPALSTGITANSSWSCARALDILFIQYIVKRKIELLFGFTPFFILVSRQKALPEHELGTLQCKFQVSTFRARAAPLLTYDAGPKTKHSVFSWKPHLLGRTRATRLLHVQSIGYLGNVLANNVGLRTHSASKLLFSSASLPSGVLA